MTVTRYLRTKDLAAAVGISVLQVRNYEADGLLPTVERSSTNYRRHTAQHLAALQTSQLLIVSYGRQRAQQIMQAVQRVDYSRAFALIDEWHAELARTRAQLETTREALSLLASQVPMDTQTPLAKGVRVSDAARLAGVRVSALRFWEQQELLQPVREHGSNYRLYDRNQLRRLRVVALLRQANYNFATIRTTLEELEAGQTEHALAALEQRRNEVTKTSWRCMQAISALHSYVHTFVGFGETRTEPGASENPQ